MVLLCHYLYQVVVFGLSPTITVGLSSRPSPIFLEIVCVGGGMIDFYLFLNLP